MGRATAPITEADARSFRDDGFLIVEGLFSERDVAALQESVETFKRQGLLYDQSVTEKQNYQLHGISECSRLCRALPWKPEVKQCLTTLLGGDADPLEVMGDQMFLKPARTGQGTSYHQDNAYFRRPEPERARGTGMWIGVHDCTEANGTMRVVPQSHHHLLGHARDTVSNHFISCEEDPWMVERAAQTEVAAVMPAGGVIFFSYGTAHSTGDNVTPHERAGLAFHVGPASLHDEPNITYPGSEGEGNQSQAQQDNEVIKILQAKGKEKSESTAEQLLMLLDAGDANPNTRDWAEEAREGRSVASAIAEEPTVAARKWLTGPMNTGGEEYFGVRVEGTWDEEVSRVLDGTAANDWIEGLIGSEAQRNMIAASSNLSEGTFGRMNSSELAPAGVAVAVAAATGKL
jgi:ectoine hydroxylase